MRTLLPKIKPIVTAVMSVETGVVTTFTASMANHVTRDDLAFYITVIVGILTAIKLVKEIASKPKTPPVL